jgi:hypothetical protein
VYGQIVNLVYRRAVSISLSSSQGGMGSRPRRACCRLRKVCITRVGVDGTPSRLEDLAAVMNASRLVRPDTVTVDGPALTDGAASESEARGPLGPAKLGSRCSQKARRGRIASKLVMSSPLVRIPSPGSRVSWRGISARPTARRRGKSYARCQVVWRARASGDHGERKSQRIWDSVKICSELFWRQNRDMNAQRPAACDVIFVPASEQLIAVVGRVQPARTSFGDMVAKFGGGGRSESRDTHRVNRPGLDYGIPGETGR